MKRREFFKLLMYLLGSTAFISFFYPLLRFLAPPGSEASIKKLVLPKADVPSGSARSIVLNNVPAIVINRPDKGFIVLSKVCTHLGCIVEYDRDKKIMLCPCHAGTFDLDGNVISGPPPKSLQRLPLRIEGETLVIG
ncbi:MAG TPA: ubiquinol-cytochrome c reductase iron-sulfur subunit [Dissulfurispiraceae bacterium]|nr:ubiquinol-cytochrome c reductase iron-sulfur subunit [Dissulfurispiraceae bacterium]